MVKCHHAPQHPVGMRPKLSDLLLNRPPQYRNMLYRRFVQAVLSGDLRALRVLDRMAIPKATGGERQVPDYLYLDEDADSIRRWLDLNERPAHELTATEGNGLSDEELLRRLELQRAADQRRRRRTGKRASQAKAKGSK